MKYGPWVLSVVAILIALGGQHAVSGEADPATGEIRAKSIVLLDEDGSAAFRVSTRNGYAVFEPTEAGEDPWEVRIGGDRGEMIFAREARTTRIEARGVTMHSASGTDPVIHRLLNLSSGQVKLSTRTGDESHRTIVQLHSSEPGEGGVTLWGENRIQALLWTVRGEDGVVLPHFSMKPYDFRESSAELDMRFQEGLPRIVLRDGKGDEASVFEIPPGSDDD